MGPGRPVAVGDRFNQVVKVLDVELDTDKEVTEIVTDERIRVAENGKSHSEEWL
jgi:hypothetical protein